MLVLGEITLERTVDFEKNRDFYFKVEAIDNGHPPLTGRSTLHIVVKNVNDNVPSFAEALYTAQLPEDAPVGTVVLSVSVTVYSIIIVY